MAQKVAVYKDGKREVHTLANARDLVQGAGWSWNPQYESSPAAKSPVQAKAVGKEPAQKVIDTARVPGGNMNADADEAPVAEVEPEPEVEAGLEPGADGVVDAAAEPVVVEEDVVDAAAPARGRGRRKA